MLTQNFKKMIKKRFFEIFQNYFFLYLVFIESRFYLPCTNANPISGKILASELQPKLLSASQIELFESEIS